MTYQAVNIGWLGKVVLSVDPTITGVTIGAARPIGFDAQAEIVQKVALADLLRLGMSGSRTGHRLGFAQPGEVLRVHNFRRGLWVAFQAGFRDAGTVLEVLLVKPLVLSVRPWPRHRLLWLATGCLVAVRPVKLAGKDNARSQSQRDDGNRENCGESTGL